MAMIDALSITEKKQDRAISAWTNAHKNPSSTVHKVMDETVLGKNKKSSSGSNGTAGGEVAIANSEGPSEFPLSGGTGPVKVDRIPCDSEIAHNMVSVTGLWNYGHNGQLAQNSCVIKIDGKIGHVGGRTERKYAVDFRKVGEQRSLSTLKKDDCV